MHLYTDEGDIDTTANHPFYVIGKGWVAAGDLVKGDEVYNLDGTTSIILGSEIEVLDEPVLVYNLEVEDLHSYFVGCVPILVHNYTNKTTKSFWKAYDKLTKEEQVAADRAYKLFKNNPEHPGLNFERLQNVPKSKGKIYSARIDDQYRAFAKLHDNGVLEWYDINAHDYNAITSRKRGG